MEIPGIIESKRYAELGVHHPSGEAFKILPIELKKEMELLVEKFRIEIIAIEGNLKLSENYSKKIQEKIKKV